MDVFDYIIIGAGSAGAALAGRLTEDGRRTVLLLEAGGTDRRFWIQTPIGYGKAYFDARVNWKYQTEPVAGLGGKRSYWPRGKVLGGSSAINAMVYVRGHPQDYDDWGAVAPGWSWADVAPVFRRMERFTGGADAHRGGDGPLAVSDISDEAHPLCRIYLEAARQAQLPVTPDYNGASMEGAALYQITTDAGVRASTAHAYLRPARRRPNLELRLRAQATRILFDGPRATGVAYRRGGRAEMARARREIVLCGGALNTPQLLLLSGIGPGDALRALGIETRRHAPEVGRNLQDHLGVDNLYRARTPTLNQELRPWLGKLKAGLTYLLRRKGPLSLSINQAGGFVRSSPERARPDLQLYFSPLSYTRAPAGKRPLLSPDPFPGFLLGTNPCKPTSRGFVRLRSADPLAPPEIQPNYLDTEEDREITVVGVKLARRLAETPALSAVIEAEIEPGPGVVSEAELHDFVRDHAWSVFHACGTCRMGTDADASVVDPRLRVHGVTGLRVADASIFPSITTGNTNAPAIMVGEKAADILLADAS